MKVLSWRVALWLAMPGAVVTWLVTGFANLSRAVATKKDLNHWHLTVKRFGT
jgi:uncharacterized membrane protein